MTYQVTDTQGVTYLRPSHAMMVAVVDQMYRENEEVFGDVIMTASNGVAIALHPNGSATLELPENSAVRILKNLGKDEQLTLWVQLAGGHSQSIMKLEWEEL
jgi:hypothetical protein